MARKKVHSRYATAADMVGVAMLDGMAFTQDEHWDLERHAAVYAGANVKRATYRVAFVGSEHEVPAGYIAFLAGPVRRQIIRVAVHPHLQRKGLYVGCHLLAAVVNGAAERVRQFQHKPLVVDAYLPDSAMPAAHCMFAKCGFRSYGQTGSLTRVFIPVLPAVGETANA